MRARSLLLSLAALVALVLVVPAFLATGAGTTWATLAAGTVVGEWGFDDGSGTTVEDSSSYGNDGVV